MAAALALPVVDAAPGNTITLAGTGLVPGVGASANLANQGLVTPATVTIPAVFGTTSVALTIPDGITSGILTVTASDGTSATIALNAISQYLQASQYQADAEGTDSDVAALPAGQLDEVLRDASGFVDGMVGTTLRLLQVQEDHPYRESRRIYPMRGPARKMPLVSLDAISYIVSSGQSFAYTIAGATDIYTNATAGYFEMLGYANGIATTVGLYSSLGGSARQWRITYTAGYPWVQTPRDIRKATAIIATELLVYRGIIKGGLGGQSRARKGDVQYDRRNEAFDIPAPARALLAPYCAGGFV